MSEREEAKKISAYTHTYTKKKPCHLLKKNHTNRTKKLWEEKEGKESVFCVLVFTHKRTKI